MNTVSIMNHKSKDGKLSVVEARECPTMCSNSLNKFTVCQDLLKKMI